MTKLFILAILAAFSQVSFANETAELKCPAGTKLVHGAEINIANDGSGYLVDRPSCEPQDKEKATSNGAAKTKAQ